MKTSVIEAYDGKIYYAVIILIIATIIRVLTGDSVQ
jgi:hypothetical protein